MPDAVNLFVFVFCCPSNLLPQFDSSINISSHLDYFRHLTEVHLINSWALLFSTKIILQDYCEAEMAAEKRGFGLVGDYGSDLSSSSDEEGEAVKKKAKNQEQSSQDVDPVEERQRREQERLKEREADKWVET